VIVEISYTWIKNKPKTHNFIINKFCYFATENIVDFYPIYGFVSTVSVCADGLYEEFRHSLSAHVTALCCWSLYEEFSLFGLSVLT
jgi:hypothetical protein